MSSRQMTPAAVTNAVAAAFNDAQRSTATHRRAAASLAAAASSDESTFRAAFLHALNRALVVFGREPAVERVVSFVATFAATRPPTTQTQSFSTLVFSYLLDKTSATSKAVRFRACQILGAALVALPDEPDLADEVWDTLTVALVARAADRNPRVRAAAVAALCRLQVSGVPAGSGGEGEEEDDVTSLLLAALASDSSASVRKAALGAVAVNGYTIPYIVNRTRDVKDDVRREAYAVLADRCTAEELSEDERVALVRAGLEDRAKSVRKVVVENLLVDGWLLGACGGDFASFVEVAGGLENEADVLLALGAVFGSPRSEDLLGAVQIDIDNLTSQDVLILRAMADCGASAAKVEDILPSATIFANVVQFYIADEISSRHLLSVTRRVDLADEAGRRAVEAMLHEDFLASSEVSEAVIPEAVAAMRLAMASEDDASRRMVEIILDDVLQSAGEQAAGDGHEEDEHPAFPRQDSKGEDWASLRALSIAKELFRHAKQVSSAAKAGNGLYQSLIDQAVIPRLASSDGGLRYAGFEALALFCLLDSSGKQAKVYLPLFFTACRNDNEEIQELAMHIIADLYMVFDFSVQEGEESVKIEGGSSDDDDFHSASGDSPGGRQEIPVTPAKTNKDSPIAQVDALLSGFINSPDHSLRYAAIEALARLLFSRRVPANWKLLSRLLLSYFNPVNKDNGVYICQCLSVFFPSFAFSAPQHRLALEASFEPTMEVLLDARVNDSPLSLIAPLSVAQFLLYLTNPSSVPVAKGRALRQAIGGDFTDKAATTHERIAEALFTEILDIDEDAEPSKFRLYARIISCIRLVSTADNDHALRRLRKLSNKAVAEVHDKQSLAPLRKFDKHIQSLAGNDQQVDGADRDQSNDGGEEGGSDESSENDSVQDQPAEEDVGATPERSRREKSSPLQQKSLKSLNHEKGVVSSKRSRKSTRSVKNEGAENEPGTKPTAGVKLEATESPDFTTEAETALPSRPQRNARNRGNRIEEVLDNAGAGSESDKSDSNLSGDDEEVVEETKPVREARPRRTSRNRRSYVEEPTIDLTSGTEDDDESYNGDDD